MKYSILPGHKIFLSTSHPRVPVDVESGLAAIQTAIDMMNNNQFAETEAMLEPL